MARAAFILLRILTAFASMAALGITLIFIAFTGLFSLLKDGGHIFMAMGRLFASGLRDSGPTPPASSPIPLPLVGLAILFVTMFSSTLLPSQKMFLHIVAAMAVAAAAWRIWSMAVTHDREFTYLPVIALWFVYYAICLRQPAPHEPASL